MTTFKLQNLTFLLPAIVLTLWAASMEESILRSIALILIWLTSLLYTVPVLAKPIQFLRKIPFLLWLLWISGMVACFVLWWLNFQPAVGLEIRPIEWFWLFACAYALILLPFAGYSRTEIIRIGWTANFMLTLSSSVFILLFLEMALRFLWVSSDNFQFSKIHQNWARLYWNPINELNFRDYPPQSSNDERINILVMGDSLASGYGVNEIEDTFPQQLLQLLGDNYTVNIAAEPGWGVSSALYAAQNYPSVPDVLILSHYINDINEGTAGQVYGRSFPQIRLEPDVNLTWWLDNFYLANFLYYRVFLYTQYDSVGLYNDWVYGAYADEAVWSAYEGELQAVIDWADSEDIALLVLVWANLRDIEGSRQLTDPVINFFASRGIPVVDMGDILARENPSRLTVNLFDAHPSIYSHQAAANALAPIIENLED